MVNLEEGLYGSNCPTLGAYNYRGFDVVVDDDMSMPVEGGRFAVGVYRVSDEKVEYMEDLIDIVYGENFSMELASKIVDDIIDWHLRKRSRCQFVVNTGLKFNVCTDVGMNDMLGFPTLKENECTCGAKHTSNPSFHMSWCDKK